MNAPSGNNPIQFLGKDAIELGIRAGNINIAGRSRVEMMDLNQESLEAQIQHADTIRKFETQKRARSIVVPTSVEDVKQKLRELGQPITLFGEGPGDRRERLKEVIASFELEGESLKKLQSSMYPTSSTSHGQASKTQKESSYSVGSESLQFARKQIGEYSFKKAHERIITTKATREQEDLQAKADETTLKSYSFIKELVLNSSQVGDDRPMTSVRFSFDGNYLASSSLGSMVKAWDRTSLSNIFLGRGHEERVTSVSWLPRSSNEILASSSADKTCKLWNFRHHLNGSSMQDSSTSVTASQTLQGHTGVVSECDFHPLGDYVGTSSHDFTWRLWDVESGAELLLQDGHTKECSTISFQGDGSLVLTGDVGGLVLVWDTRSGQCVQVLQGHIKKIVNSHFNPNGFQAATCSVDNLVRIWDLRKKKCSYILPAHSSAITNVRYSSSGEHMVTSSFDGTLKVFGVRDYRVLNTLSGHLGKVMSCDFSPDERHLASAGFDRTIKLWAHKDEF